MHHQPSSERARSRSITLISIVAAAVFLTGMNAGAQVYMEEVVVTAQKREQNVQDIGIAITALSGELITALGYEKATMVVDMAPGVQLVQPNAQASFGFAIRGVIQTDFSDNQEHPVAIYVDEAYVSQASGAGFQLFDLDRVEILRGPQGTLYGRNATGGTVSFVTRKPSQEFEAYIQAKYGSYDNKGTEFAIGGPITERISARFSGTGNWHDPYTENTIGPDIFNDNSAAFRGQVLFEFNDDVSLLLNGRGGYQEVVDGVGEIGPADVNPANFAGFDREPDDALPNTRPPGGAICPGCNFLGYREPDDGPWVVTVDSQGHNDLHVWGGGARLEWAFDRFDLVSITDYAHLDKDYTEDSDDTPVTALRFFLNNNAEQFSEEIRLSGERENFRWLAGFYWLRIRGEYSNGFTIDSPYFGGAHPGIFPADAFTPMGVNVFGPDIPCFGTIHTDLINTCGPQPTSHAAGTLVLQNTVEQNTDSYSVFFQTEFDVRPDLTMITGFRWIEEQKNFNLQQILAFWDDSNPGSENRLHSQEIGAVTYVFNDDSAGTLAHYNKGLWSAKLGFELDVNDDLLAYLTWNRGVKGGGFNMTLEMETLRPEDVQYQEEVLNAYEVGFKLSLYENRIRVNGSMFFYNYGDFQALIFEGLGSKVLNKDAEIYGAELEFQGSPWRGLDFVGGVSYLQAKAFDLDFSRTGTPNPQERALPQAPMWTVNGLARYQFQPVFKNTFFAGRPALQMDFNYRTEQNFLLTNAPAGMQAAYVIGNARVSYASEDGRWETAFAVRNLTNQAYATVRFDVGGSFGFTQRFVSIPRWFYGTVRVNF